jgi:hypothetical protein
MPNVRRSLTITEENDERVQQRRAMFLSIPKTPLDMDYTTAVNMLIELGDFLFKQIWTNPIMTIDRKGIADIISKYLYSPALKQDGLVDQYQDLYLLNLLKIIDTYQKITAIQHQQNLPDPQQTKQAMPKNDKGYIR